MMKAERMSGHPNSTYLGDDRLNSYARRLSNYFRYAKRRSSDPRDN
jgi:hypothetical protein